jgi:murein DD-endopeptidase
MLNRKYEALYLAICFVLSPFGTPSSLASTLRDSFDISVAVAPTPVPIGNREELVYEVRLTNFSPDELQLDTVTLLEGSSQKQLALWSDHDLVRRFQLVGTTDDPGNSSMTVRPGQVAIIYIEYECKPSKVPMVLLHRVDYSVAGQQSHFSVTGGRVSVQKEAPVELGPPLSGGPWVAVYSPDWQRGHRRVFYAVDGMAHLPGRFAVDFFKVDDEGKKSHGDPDLVKDALGYGASVLAVADAQVVAVRDGISESERISEKKSYPLGEGPGNYVVLRLDNHRFAVYEHLKPHSICVVVGDHVQRGKMIAALGFTGDSTGPHLHFDVADGPEPLDAEGLPFVFNHFRVTGDYTDIADLGVRRWNLLTAGQRNVRAREMPQPDAVLFF